MAITVHRLFSVMKRDGEANDAATQDFELGSRPFRSSPSTTGAGRAKSPNVAMPSIFSLACSGQIIRDELHDR